MTSQPPRVVQGVQGAFLWIWTERHCHEGKPLPWHVSSVQTLPTALQIQKKYVTRLRDDQTEVLQGDYIRRRMTNGKVLIHRKDFLLANKRRSKR